MRLHIGSVPENPEFTPTDYEWTLVREPAPDRLILYGVPLSVALAAGVVAFLYYATPVRLREGSGSFLIAVLLLIWPVHELLHVLGFPDLGFSRKTVIGFLPEKVLFYALFEGEITRNRLLVAASIPLMALTALPVLAAASLRLTHPFIGFLSVANALISAIDLMVIVLLIGRVPRDAILRGKGWKTYWRKSGAG